MTRSLLKAAKLYVVLDTAVADFEKLFVILKETVAAGTTIVQIRCKNGPEEDIVSFVKKALPYTKGKALLIVNDCADLAVLSGSDGVHVGQDDLNVKEAKKICGASKIVGVSCQTLAQAKQAEKDGADYIGFGSVFKTKTKPDRIGLDLKIVSQIAREIRIPVFFIGGITLENADEVIQRGGQRIAVTRAVCEAKDVGLATRKLLSILRG